MTRKTPPSTSKSGTGKVVPDGTKPGPEPLAGTGKKLPGCPTYLGKFGQEAYAQVQQALRDMKLEDGADQRAVEAFAAAYEDYREAREVIDESGMTFETYTKEGELREMKRPEMDIQIDAWKRMTSLLPHLCLTPASRMKGKSPPKPKEDEDPFARFMPTPN